MDLIIDKFRFVNRKDINDIWFFGDKSPLLNIDYKNRKINYYSALDILTCESKQYILELIQEHQEFRKNFY